MTDDRISPPVTRLDTPHDRSSERAHFEALERARDRGRRQSRHHPPRWQRPTRAASAPAPPEHLTRQPDETRGTHLDVLA